MRGFDLLDFVGGGSVPGLLPVCQRLVLRRHKVYRELGFPFVVGMITPFLTDLNSICDV
jgi:hypothetical protein